MYQIDQLISNQRHFFKTQKTKDVSKRIAYLKQLKNEILANEDAIYEALQQDFRKSAFESYLSELGLVISELDLAIKNLKRWGKPKRVRGSMLIFPSKSYIYKEPYGTVLIIGPWNYPFQLTLNPLVMAIAAGNTVVLKPSELTPNTSQLVADIIEKIFPKELATTVLGGIPVATELLEKRWDYIFFTGSVTVGKIVAKAAARHLTPITLELGGKTPCIIDESVNFKLIARRIAWGKLLNGGQTCIAPDYIIVKTKVKQQFVDHLTESIEKAYKDIKLSEDYPRIINEKNFKRLVNLMQDETILYGGEHDSDELFIAPTLLDAPELDSKVMTEEIFGPILPILTFETEDDLERIIWHNEKPLSLYVFSNNALFVNKILSKFSFGGGAVNDTLVHYGNPNLPFGGVGESGIGAYHGKFGFDTFSHHKSVVKRANWIDPPIRYAPYKGKMKQLKTLFKWFG